MFRQSNGGRFPIQKISLTAGDKKKFSLFYDDKVKITQWRLQQPVGLLYTLDTYRSTSSRIELAFFHGIILVIYYVLNMPNKLFLCPIQMQKTRIWQSE
jgi:hypothetical protein